MWVCGWKRWTEKVIVWRRFLWRGSITWEITVFFFFFFGKNICGKVNCFYFPNNFFFYFTGSTQKKKILLEKLFPFFFLLRYKLDLCIILKGIWIMTRETKKKRKYIHMWKLLKWFLCAKGNNRRMKSNFWKIGKKYVYVLRIIYWC